MSERVEFSLTSSGGTSTLNIYLSTPGPHLNPHGGNADVYSFVFPAGLSHVRGDQIARFTTGSYSAPLDFGASSTIDLRIDRSGCQIVVKLFRVNGQPYVVNGVHKMKNCGQQRL